MSCTFSVIMLICIFGLFTLVMAKYSGREEKLLQILDEVKDEIAKDYGEAAEKIINEIKERIKDV